MRATLFAAALALALAAPAFASACVMTTTEADFDSDPLGLGLTIRYYVDNDDCNATGLCVFSIWIYKEANGVDGLQRQDEVVDDTCSGAAGPGDAIIL